MNKEEILKAIAEEISSILEIQSQDITLQTNLVDDLSIQSIEVFILIANLEKRFKVHIKEEKIRTIVTVEDMVNLVNELHT